MIKSIKNFIFNKTEVKPEYEEYKVIVKDALDHYCAKCKTGFKTKAARNAHNAIKHKNE